MTQIQTFDIAKSDTFYAISIPNISQKVAILTHSQFMTITLFLALVTQIQNFLPVTYIKSFRGPS